MKAADKTMCRSSTEENKNRYKSMKNEAENSFLKATSEKADQPHAGFKNCPNVLFKLVSGLRIDSKEVYRWMIHVRK